MKMKTALTIAGSDCSGGAGIQADIKTMTMNGVYAMSAITALTAQNTTGVRSIMESTPEFLKDQIDAVFEDIRPDAVKIGMVASAELIETIADRLSYYKAENIVVDPVMVATSGSELMKSNAVTVLRQKLLPLATLVTPNIPEAEVLSGESIQGKEDMERVAKLIGDTHGCAVLLKGGHSVNDANDLLYVGGNYKWFCGNVSIIPTLTARAVRYRPRLRPILQKDMTLKLPSGERRTTYRARSEQCLISVQSRAR